MTDEQLSTLATIERVASCFSVVGTLFVFLTFISSSEFRRPVNRLVFYATWGNTMCNIGTLISESGIEAGAGSSLCTFQAFLIQMFVPADAFWNLCMALNVYLTLFKKYNAQQLKALEWRYHCFCYGVPFITAFTLIFVHTEHKIYGPAVLWCWISKDWEYLRVLLCYGPAWICIVSAFAIYLFAGIEIFKKRRELRAFNGSTPSDSWASFKTTQIAVTSEFNDIAPFSQVEENFGNLPGVVEKAAAVKPVAREIAFDQYSVNISTPPKPLRPSMPPSMTSQQLHKNRAAIEANRAAWGYTKVALLFFVSLLVTWVPSSANRLYTLAHPEKSNIALSYSAGIVLSLMGFWNAVIYIFTSRAACKELIVSVFARGKIPRHETARRSVQEIPSPRRSPTPWIQDLERLPPSSG